MLTHPQINNSNPLCNLPGGEMFDPSCTHETKNEGANQVLSMQTLSAEAADDDDPGCEDYPADLFPNQCSDLSDDGKTLDEDNQYYYCCEYKYFCPV